MANNQGKFSSPVYDTRPDFYKLFMNAVSAALSVNTETGLLPDGLNQGNIQIITSAAFNGTTATLALQGSNDGTNWSTVYQDDDTTPVSFTLAVSSTYNVLLKRVLYRHYRTVYTVGNATLGAISASIVAKH